jgi:hypothetical protein
MLGRLDKFGTGASAAALAAKISVATPTAAKQSRRTLGALGATRIYRQMYENP